MTIIFIRLDDIILPIDNISYINNDNGETRITLKDANIIRTHFSVDYVEELIFNTQKNYLRGQKLERINK